MSYLLVTPNVPPELMFMEVVGFGKRPIHCNKLRTPVKIDDVRYVGMPGVSAELMSLMRFDAPALYRLLTDLIDSGESATIPGLQALRRLWTQKAWVENLRGEVTILLVSDKGKPVVHTFNTDREVAPLEITEPTFYQAGNILTQDNLVEQIQQVHQERLSKVKHALDRDHPAGIDLRLL